MRRTGFSHSATRLRLETLETRQLMAAAAFELQLYSDDGGVPGEAILDGQLTAGETFFVQITAEEFDPRRFGLRSAAVDVDWDAGILQVVEADFDLETVITPDLPLYRQGDLDNAAGRIDELGGFAFLAAGAGRAIGNLQGDVLATIRMQAGPQAGDATIQLGASDTEVITVPSRSLPTQLMDYGSLPVHVLPADNAPSENASVEVTTSQTVAEPDLPANDYHDAAELTHMPEAIGPYRGGELDLGHFGALNVLVGSQESLGAVTVSETEVEAGRFEPSGSPAVIDEGDQRRASPHRATVCTPMPQTAAAAETWLDALAQAWLDDAERRRQRAA